MLKKRITKKRVKSRNRNKAKDGKRNVVGSRIHELRVKANPPVTQEDMAGRVAALGVVLDRTAIYRIETGSRTVTDVELVALAKALRVKIADLFV